MSAHRLVPMVLAIVTDCMYCYNPFIISLFIHFSCLQDEEDDPLSPLRPVNALDFKLAIKKLKASVDDSGKELQKVRYS